MVDEQLDNITTINYITSTSLIDRLNAQNVKNVELYKI
jgi:hypothetical protein